MGRKLSNGRFTKAYDEKITPEFLYHEYIVNKKSPYMIANELKINPKTIYNYLDYYKIPKEDRKGQIKAGDQFKMLTTIEVVGKQKNGAHIWLCKCSCGSLTKANTASLKNGRRASCGCYKTIRPNHSWKGYCGISGSRVSEIKYRANKKGLEFNLTAEFLWNLFIQQNKKCAITNVDINLEKDASLDRIDNSKGYTTDNVWWVHQKINKMKLDFSLTEFIKLCESVATNKENIEWTK